MARGSISTATPDTFFAQTGGLGDTGGGDGSQQEPVGMLRPQVPGSTTADLAPHKEAVPNPVNDGGPWLDKAPMSVADSGSGFLAKDQVKPSPYGDVDNTSVIAPNPGHTFAQGENGTLPIVKKGEDPRAFMGQAKNSYGSSPIEPMQAQYDNDREGSTAVPTSREGREDLGRRYSEEKQGRAQFESLTKNSASIPDGGEAVYDKGMRDAISGKEKPESEGAPQRRGGIH